MGVNIFVFGGEVKFDISDSTITADMLPPGVVAYNALGERMVGKSIRYTNQIPISTDTDGSIYDGDGYSNNTYLSSSGSVGAYTGGVTSGFIPYTPDKYLCYEGIDMVTTNTYSRIVFYDSSKTRLGYCAQTGQAASNTHLNHNFTITAEGDHFKMTPSNVAANYPSTAYIRICCGLGITGDEWIVTVNEEIT